MIKLATQTMIINISSFDVYFSRLDSRRNSSICLVQSTHNLQIDVSSPKGNFQKKKSRYFTHPWKIMHLGKLLDITSILSCNTLHIIPSEMISSGFLLGRIMLGMLSCNPLYALNLNSTFILEFLNWNITLKSIAEMYLCIKQDNNIQNFLVSHVLLFHHFSTKKHLLKNLS